MFPKFFNNAFLAFGPSICTVLCVFLSTPPHYFPFFCFVEGPCCISTPSQTMHSVWAWHLLVFGSNFSIFHCGHFSSFSQTGFPTNLFFENNFCGPKGLWAQACSLPFPDQQGPTNFSSKVENMCLMTVSSCHAVVFSMSEPSWHMSLTFSTTPWRKLQQVCFPFWSLCSSWIDFHFPFSHSCCINNNVRKWIYFFRFILDWLIDCSVFFFRRYLFGF